MNLWQQYLSPHSLAEAIQALSIAPGRALPIAGGTDLLLDMAQGRQALAQTLVDITGIPELVSIEEREGRLFIGAAAALNRVAGHPLVRHHAQALVEACDLIGGPQVRNVATLGGNVAHALPAADGTIALLALDAKAEVAALSGTRQMPLGDLFLGPGKSAIHHGEELLVGFYLPISPAHQASAFKRIMRPQGVALPIINLAVRLTRHGDLVQNVRIVVGPGAAVPWRAAEAESDMIGGKLDNESIDRALEALLTHVGFRTSPRRASAEYRRHLVGSLFRDALQTAWQRAA